MDTRKPTKQFLSLRPFRLPPGSGPQLRGQSFGALLLISVFAVATQADQPGMHSVLRRPVVQSAEPFTIRDIDTRISTISASSNQPDRLRLAQTSPPPAPSRQEQLPPPLAASTRDSQDPGIKPMSAISIDISPPVQLDSFGQPLRTPEDFAGRVYRDQPPFPHDPTTNGPWFSDAAYGPQLNFCYRPLYFEEPNLERYGRTAGLLQPLISAGNFFGNVAVLPYRLVAQRPGYCTYHEHLFRPGAPAAWH